MSSIRFIAVPAAESVVAELSALLPANPFATAGFFEARRRLGYVAWVLGLRVDAGRLQCGCGSFLKAGKLNLTLEIPSVPAVDAESEFWVGVREFCRRQRVTKLELGTYASPPGVVIPSLTRSCAQAKRCEFVLELADDRAAKLSSSHKKNLKRAQRAGLVVRRTRSLDAASAHLTLMNGSMARRRSRGEETTPTVLSPELPAFLETGAGELFQALRDDTVVSSVLVLLAPQGGYTYSSGTSIEGMKVSASHFLRESIARQLRADGANVLNLGGADENSTLASFKEGFGALRVPLPSATCYVGPSWRLRVSQGIALLRSDRRQLLALLHDRISRMIVYAVYTAQAQLPVPQVGLTFRALTPDDLRSLAAGDLTFRERQLDRLRRFDASHAYAVFADHQLAHVSWLLPHTAMERDPPRVFRARPFEAEITGCETLPEFRGRGIYGVAIRHLVQVARRQQIRRVFMKTATDNKSSQTGIEKAGLERVGSAIFIVLPVTQRLVIWRRFR